MPETTPTPTTPQVQDRRSRPLGILPQNMQLRVLGGVAALMVIVIALSGRSAPKPKNAAAPPAVNDPNEMRIEEYQKAVAEQTRKLQLEQAQLLRTQQTLGLSPAEAPGIGAGLPSSTPRSAGYARMPDRTEADMPGSPPSPERSLEADMEKRAYASLFASNIVLSYRSTVGESLSPPTNARPAPAAALTPQGASSSLKPETATDSRHDDVSDDRNLKDREQSRNLDRADGKNYRLFEGTILETILTNRLDGSFAGPVNCMVTTNVYSHNGLYLLIPQGSRVLGEVKHVETFGQQRLAVMFHRLIMPDGYSVSLDKYQGLNEVGETGLSDQVNHHYMQVFGVSLAIGAIAGLSQANTNYGLNESAADAYRQGVASSLSQSSLQILDRYLNVLPTFTIREGHRVKIYLSDDLLLPAYDRHEMPADL